MRRNNIHAKLEVTKVLLPKDYLDLRGTQMFSTGAALEHLLHESLHNPLGARRQTHTTPSSHNTALVALIPPLTVRRTDSSWIHEWFVARALAAAPPNTLLGWERPKPLVTQMRLTCIDNTECL